MATLRYGWALLSYPLVFQSLQLDRKGFQARWIHSPFHFHIWLEKNQFHFQSLQLYRKGFQARWMHFHFPIKKLFFAISSNHLLSNQTGLLLIQNHFYFQKQIFYFLIEPAFTIFTKLILHSNKNCFHFQIKSTFTFYSK